MLNRLVWLLGTSQSRWAKLGCNIVNPIMRVYQNLTWQSGIQHLICWLFALLLTVCLVHVSYALGVLRGKEERVPLRITKTTYILVVQTRTQTISNSSKVFLISQPKTLKMLLKKEHIQKVNIRKIQKISLQTLIFQRRRY